MSATRSQDGNVATASHGVAGAAPPVGQRTGLAVSSGRKTTSYGSASSDFAKTQSLLQGEGRDRYLVRFEVDGGRLTPGPAGFGWRPVFGPVIDHRKYL